MAMVATSCQKDTDLEVNAGETVSVSINVGTPTRAYSDGTTATVLQYAVYDAAGNYLEHLTGSKEIHGSTTIELKLVTGNSYDVICWAAAEGAPYTVDFAAKSMTVDYATAVSNDETRDAFYKKQRIDVRGAQTETIELKRPFAQLNIGTNDYEDARKAGYVPTESAVKVTNIYNTLDLWEGKVSGEAAVEFASAEIKKDETFPVAGHQYLAMNYLLVSAEQETIEVEFTYSGTAAVAAEASKTRIVGSVPVQRNYRTNLYGSLLTSDVNINVVIVPDYETPSLEADALYQAAAFGGEVTLTEDVELASALNVQANMTINLNGHNITITAPYDGNNYEASSAIVNNAVLTLTGNGEISATNNYTVRNNGTMVIDGVTIKNGIMNFGDLTVESGNISNSRSGKHGIYGNAAKLTINGGTFHNDNPGNATIFAYGGEVAINGGEFTIADGTATLGWTSCLLDAQGGAKYTINGGLVKGTIRDYGNNTTIYGGIFTSAPTAAWVAEGKKVLAAEGVYVVVDVDVNGYLASEVTNKDGERYEGDVFTSGYMENALWYNKWVFGGEASINVENKTYGAIIVENCSGEFKNDVITINNTNNSVMVLQNLDFTIAEGKKLIKSVNTIYQVFMSNITINGEKMTQETIGQYLENVGWYQVVEEI